MLITFTLDTARDSKLLDIINSYVQQKSPSISDEPKIEEPKAAEETDQVKPTTPTIVKEKVPEVKKVDSTKELTMEVLRPLIKDVATNLVVAALTKLTGSERPRLSELTADKYPALLKELGIKYGA